MRCLSQQHPTSRVLSEVLHSTWSNRVSARERLPWTAVISKKDKEDNEKKRADKSSTNSSPSKWVFSGSYFHEISAYIYGGYRRTWKKISKVCIGSSWTYPLWQLHRTEKGLGGNGETIRCTNWTNPHLSDYLGKAHFTRQSKQKVWRHCSTEKLRVLELQRAYCVPKKQQTTALLRAASIYGFGFVCFF